MKGLWPSEWAQLTATVDHLLIKHDVGNRHSSTRCCRFGCSVIRAADPPVRLNGLLGVALTAEPADTPFTIHPIIDIGFAVKAVNFPGLGARVLGYDSPIIVRLSDGSEGHFCFCHETLCN